jgi:hypothetical protein
MPTLPTVLLVLSLPVGGLAYALAARVMESLPLPDGAQLLTLLVPLFVAGLAMMPLLIPFFDRKAKQDLAAYRRSQELAAKDGDDAPDEPEDLAP